MLDSVARVKSVQKELAAVAFGLSRPQPKVRRILDEQSHEVLHDLLGGAMSLAGAQRGMIVLPLGDAEGEVKVAAAIGLNADEAWASGGISQSIVRTVLTERRGVLTHNAVEDGRFSGKNSVVVSGLRSVLCMPLFKDSLMWGLLYLDNPARSGAFKELHMSLLKDFSLLTTDLVEAPEPSLV
jgi:GAF domain-containing protein